MILAVDTSCYTTSLTVIDLSGDILFESYELLKVKEGTKGLRQSEGFYQHVYALNDAFSKFAKIHCPSKILAVACSTKPRPLEGSYMPVFEAGRLFCDNLSKTLNVPLYAFSHQEGHIMAAYKTSTLKDMPSEFFAMHLSGGTTEWMRCQKKDLGFEIILLGESLDISFGQLVDRIGVSMGIDFPCGQAMDLLSQKNTSSEFFKIKMRNNQFNLSGYENKYLDFKNQHSPEEVSRHLFNTLAHLMKQWIDDVPKDMPILVAGGVASNSIIRNVLSSYKNLYFAKPKYAKDNALGIAFLGLLAFDMER